MDGKSRELKAPEPVQTTHPAAYNGPDWEVPEGGSKRRKGLHFGYGSTSTRWAISDRFDRLLPLHKRYIGLTRKALLCVICAIVLCLIALCVGLAVGLTKKHKEMALPLPNGAQTYTGDLTYYNPALGACGMTSGDGDAVAAVSHYTFDAVQKGSDPNQNPLCGKKIRASRTREDGKQVSIDVTVIDRCTGCQPTDIDVSPAMFDKMANHDLGRVTITWAWL